MYIVGTSGHIDHGKTSLIKALTDIDCDRLPEEKAREMTIDIGFASIDYPRFGTVSIIDVPGHERFIRNMVAGAWGIDLALLVVAVDDGWMPQTEDHFRVLDLLGVERVIAVLNKIDLADEEMISFVAEEINEKLGATRFAGADIVRVSAKNGHGIDELKEAILANLRKLPKAVDAKKPYLFVDRVFASRGYGTVLTGTLKNGSFHEDDVVLLLPQMREARIRKIESHYQALPEGVPSQRTALNVSGASAEELRRGQIVTRENFFTGSADAVVKIQLLEKRREVKNNLGMEILVGTTSLKGKLILLGEIQGGDVFSARIKFDSPWFFYPGEPFILTNPGGFRIVGGGIVLLPDYQSLPDKKRARDIQAVFQRYSIDEILHFSISARSYVEINRLAAMLPQSRKVLDGHVSSLLERGVIVRVGDYLLDREFHGTVLSTILSVITQNVGLNLREIADHSRIDADFCRAMLPSVMKDHSVVEKDGRYFTGGAITADRLPADRKETLRMVRDRGAEGIELDKVDDEVVRKSAKELVKLGFLVSLDGNILLHREVYDDLKIRIMSLFGTRDRISVVDAKDITQLSRKYIIPLLNRIESDGLVKRIGDFRIRA